MPEQRWHPFSISRNGRSGARSLRLLSGQGLNLQCCTWRKLTPATMCSIWKHIVAGKTTHGYEPAAVMLDLFPRPYYRKRIEEFLLRIAARNLKEAACGE